MAKIKVPAESNGAKFKDNWRRCVGTGHLGLALQEQYQELLGLVQEHIGFDYIRGHGLLSDGMGIYRQREGVSEPVYNFTYIDRVFDSYLSQGIKPFVELGFMPSALASGTQTQFYWKANVTPPKDYRLWRDLIQELIKHLIKRYGLEEVRTWPFEVWNEPDLPQFWSADQAEYFKLYRETAYAIKEIDADIRVGGPATCPGAVHWIADFLQMCEREKVPVDFVTQHSYCAKDAETGPELTYHDMYPITHILDQFKQSRQHIIDSAFPDDMPLHITEYNTSYSPRCPIHDTAFNAAFLARVLSEGADYADSFSYWTFCDVFEEQDIPQSQFHGGFGLVALNGVVKPTFHLFAFFAHLGEELLYRDENMIVTRRDDGSIALVAWNPVREKGTGFERRFELEIPIKFREVFMKQQVVDEFNGNAWNLWRDMGRPRYPTEYQIEAMRHAAVPAISWARKKSESGIVDIEFTLTKNGICLIELDELVDETPTYPGLDDSKIPGY